MINRELESNELVQIRSRYEFYVGEVLNSYLEERRIFRIRNINDSKRWNIEKKKKPRQIFLIKKNYRLHDYRTTNNNPRKDYACFLVGYIHGIRGTYDEKKRERERETKKENKKNDNEITDESDVIR